VPRFEGYESDTITHTHTVDLPQRVIGSFRGHYLHSTQ